jgi:hypothetical protein
MNHDATYIYSIWNTYIQKKVSQAANGKQEDCLQTNNKKKNHILICKCYIEIKIVIYFFKKKFRFHWSNKTMPIWIMVEKKSQ